MAGNSLERIFARRSIRRFRSKPVEDEKIQLLLKAAMASPSAHDSKPWHFILIRDRNRLDGIAQMHPYGKMCYEATLAIIVCADPSISRSFWVQDCSASTENILLAATSLGLGACWVGVHPRAGRKERLRKTFNIPDTIEILSIVALGYPGEKKSPRTQFDGARIHDEHW